jgi:Tfp pilus assembly protein PilX
MKRHQRGNERGVALISSMIGALIMLLTLLMATHVILNLQRRSLVHAVAVNAVTAAAREGGSEVEQSERVGRLLGPTARPVWSSSGADVVLNVTVRGVQLIAVGPLAELATINIEVRARREELN